MSKILVATQRQKRKANASNLTELSREQDGLLMHRPVNALAEPFFQPNDAALEAEEELDLDGADAWDDCNDIISLDVRAHARRSLRSF